DWCPGCLAPFTRILTPAGSTPIADIKVGEKVLGHDGAYHRVTEVMSHWHDAPIQRVAIQFLGELLLTDDHPFWTAAAVDGRRVMDWRPAGQLRTGDIVAYPTNALVRELAYAGAGARQAATRAPREAADD